jgi:hypothetical protein
LQLGRNEKGQLKLSNFGGVQKLWFKTIMVGNKIEKDERIFFCSILQI